MPLDRDPLDDLKGYKPITMQFHIRNRVLKPEEKEQLLEMLNKDIQDAKQMKRVFTIVEKTLGALAKGAFLVV